MGIWGPNKHELKLDEAVRSSAKVATRFDAIRLRPGEVLSITGTRFGGTPYAEAGETWPMLDDKPYDFVGQFDLRECFEPPTDAYDLLSIFVAWHELEEGDVDRATERACVIRTYRKPSSEKAAVMARPLGTATQDYRVAPCAAKSCRILSYPSPVISFMGIPAIAELSSEHRDFDNAYVKSLKRIGYNWRNEHTQVGGYPTWVHDNTLEDKDMIFILRVAHEPAANFCIGDAAPLFIAARRSDPTKFEVDPWQSH